MYEYISNYSVYCEPYIMPVFPFELFTCISSGCYIFTIIKFIVLVRQCTAKID